MSSEINLEILNRLMKKASKEIPSSPLLKLPRSGGRNGFYVPTKTVQAKRHKRKSSRRWQKKWLKKFGTIEVPRWNVAVVSDFAMKRPMSIFMESQCFRLQPIFHSVCVPEKNTRFR